MKNNPNKEIEDAEEAIKKGWTLIENYEIMDNIPPPFKRVKEDREEIIAFFDKLPQNKVMRIRFPDEYLWNSYATALKYYASEYPFVMQFNKRKDDKAYYLYIRKLEKVEVKDGTKDMEK